MGRFTYRPAAVRSYIPVGATGFEPATSCSRSRRATELRYAPKVGMVAGPYGLRTVPTVVQFAVLSAPRKIRTPNLLIRSQTLYPIELWALGRRRGVRVEGTYRPTAFPCCRLPSGRYKTRTCDLHDVNVAL